MCMAPSTMGVTGICTDTMFTLLITHATLLHHAQEIQDPDSPEIGLTAYQLATCYYAHDMLPDAGSMISWSSKVFKQHYPEGHDLIILCKHRLGMICAAGRDTRAGLVLLSDTNDHYKQQDDGHPLRHEAELGLAMVR